MRINLRRRLIPVLIVLGLMVVQAGCGITQLVKQHPIKGSYYISRTAFNDALESYLVQKAIVPQEDQEKISSAFHEGANALDLWGLAIASGDSSVGDKQEAYIHIKDELFRLLLKYDILKLGGDA